MAARETRSVLRVSCGSCWFSSAARRGKLNLLNRPILPRMQRGVTVAIACAAAVLGLSACGGGGSSASSASVEPIEIVSKPASVGDPISLDIPLDESGAFVFDQWPSACALTDKATLSGIFPQADDVLQSGKDREVKLLSVGGDSRPSVTVPDADCNTTVGFPFDGLRATDGHVVVSFISTIEAAGSPTFVERNTAHKGGQEVQIGGATCVVTQNRYDCTMENIAFGIVVDARTYGQYVGEGESAYVVDGESVTYSGGDGFDEMVNEKVLLPVVTAAIQRLS